MKKKIVFALLILVVFSALLVACGGTSNGPSNKDLANILASFNSPNASNPEIVSKINCEIPEDIKANGVSEIWYLSYTTASGAADGRIFLQKINGEWAVLKDFYQCTEIK